MVQRLFRSKAVFGKTKIGGRVEQVEWVCEWCEPSDIPASHPELCKIQWCPKHCCDTWHWPRVPFTVVDDTGGDCE